MDLTPLPMQKQDLTPIESAAPDSFPDTGE
jgi:hypothetical protein